MTGHYPQFTVWPLVINFDVVRISFRVRERVKDGKILSSLKHIPSSRADFGFHAVFSRRSKCITSGNILVVHGGIRRRIGYQGRGRMLLLVVMLMLLLMVLKE